MSNISRHIHGQPADDVCVSVGELQAIIPAARCPAVIEAQTPRRAGVHQQDARVHLLKANNKKESVTFSFTRSAPPLSLRMVYAEWPCTHALQALCATLISLAHAQIGYGWATE